MKNPVFVSGLLENIGASEYVKPLDLIRRIPEGMEIIGLRNRLVKIISDYNLQVFVLSVSLVIFIIYLFIYFIVYLTLF